MVRDCDETEYLPTSCKGGFRPLADSSEQAWVCEACGAGAPWECVETPERRLEYFRDLTKGDRREDLD